MPTLIGHSSSSWSITRWLEQTNGIWFSIYAAGAAFCVYSCVYAMRKAFSVATFDGLVYFNISYKVWLVTFQVMGYALSKFIGIKFISELKAASRSSGILLMAAIASGSWLLFGIVGAPYNIIFLFSNGLALGMVWGMVFGYLEGRRFTEALGAGLSVSFIFSAGFAKTVGATMMLTWGTSERWMPFVTAAVFFVPLIFFLYLLDQVPPPSREDEALRTKRLPMNGVERKRFTMTFGPGLFLFIAAYLMLTAFRDFRDNFSAEVWKSLDTTISPQIFTTTEIPIALLVLVAMGSVMFVKNNFVALVINHVMIILGMVIIGLGTFLFEAGHINPLTWMVSIGLGLYLGYVPFNSIFFDRMLATFNYVGTVGFVMYLADSVGYLGSVVAMFFKEFGFAKISWVKFFISTGYFISVAGSLLMIASMLYFRRKHQLWKAQRPARAATGGMP